MGGRPPAQLARGDTKLILPNGQSEVSLPGKHHLRLGRSDPRPQQAGRQAIHEDLLHKASDLPERAKAQFIEGPHNTTPSPLMTLVVRHPLLGAPLGRKRVVLRVFGPAPGSQILVPLAES